MTVPEVTAPLCPIPLAIVNEVGVVGLPSIPSTATNFSSLKPNFTALHLPGFSFAPFNSFAIVLYSTSFTNVDFP